MTADRGIEPYAPCNLEQLVARGYDYWALGHIHKQDVMSRDDVDIVFPGNLQGRHAKETGPKGAVLVTYDSTGVGSVEPLVLDTVRWLHCRVDVSDAVVLDDVVALASRAIVDEVGPEFDRLHAVRVELFGEMAAAGLLMSRQESWQAQLVADIAGADGRIWIERIDATGVVSTKREGQAVTEAVAAVADAVAELRRDGEKRAGLLAVLQPLRARLGVELLHVAALGVPDLSDKDSLDLLDEVETLLLSELSGGVQ